ncbi:M48 family metalloprotease [Streptomyces sp. NPDC044780]|uniref:M48 family metallopeptidase n=1 Tax=unclassified Streptomyces TaxID=2593676 RepID=UPI0033DFCAB9
MSAPAARVDERVLSAGTTPRFVLLMVLVLVASLSALDDVNYVLSYAFRPEGNALGGLGCFFAAGVDPIGDRQANQLALKRPGVPEALDACMDRFEHRLPGWPVLLELALLIAAVGVLHWALPRWKGRRGKVVPLDQRVDPTGEVRHLIDELVATAGLARSPRVVIDPAAHTPSAVVFGRWPHYTICLHGGLLARRPADPAGFRGVVLHELAHIRNRDVDITYGTVALWRVFLAVPLPANLLIAAAYFRRDFLRESSTAFAASSRPSTVYELLQAGFLIALVYLARADVLRTREFYADIDAAKWGADPRVWSHRAGAPPDAGRIRHALGAFAGLWRTHPDWTRRHQAVADPVRLFDVPRLPMFLTGAAAIIVSGWAGTSATLGQGDLPGWAEWGCALLGAGLAAVVVGTILWRAAVHAVLSGRRSPSGIRAGVWFGAGLVTGEVVLGRAADRWLPARPWFLLILLLIGVVICWWTAQHAELWARTWRGRTLGPVVLLGLVATGLVFGLWFSWWQSDGYTWVQGRSIVNREGLLTVYATWYPGLAEADSGALRTVLAVSWVAGRLGTDQFVISSEQLLMWVAGVLWLLPLLTCLWHRTPAAPRWARGDGVRPGRGLPVRRIVRCGVGGGVLALCALIVAKVCVHHVVRPGPGRPAVATLSDSVAVLVALIGAMVVAAWVAGAGDRTYRLLTGLVTAGVTALLGLLWSFLLASADGCLGRLDIAYDTCGWRPHEGWTSTVDPGLGVLGLGMFTVAAAMLVLAGLPRRRPAPPAEVPDTAAGRRRLLVAAVWGVALAFASTSELALTEVSSVTPDGTTPSRVRVLAATSPRIHTVRVLAWLRYGGSEHLDGIGHAENTFTTAATRASDYGAVVARVRPICQDIERRVADARHYFPVPDEKGHRYWTTFLDQSERAALTCQKAIDSHDVELYRMSGEQMQQTYFSHRTLYDWLQSHRR